MALEVARGMVPRERWIRQAIEAKVASVTPVVRPSVEAKRGVEPILRTNATPRAAQRDKGER